MDARTLGDLLFERVVEEAAGCCQTSRGRGLVLTSYPARNADEADRELSLVEEGMGLFDLPDHPSLDGVEDVSRSVESASKGGVLSNLELIACARMLTAGHLTMRLVGDLRLRAPGLADLFQDIKDFQPVAERVSGTFDEDGRIRDDASPRLHELRSRVVSLGKRVKTLIEDMIKDPKIQVLLQDEYYTVREGRYVLPVKAEDHRFIPGIIHGSSQTGQTFFVEPSTIVEDNNQLKVALDQIEVEEHAIRADRSRLIGRNAAEIQALGDRLWQLDSILGRARLARRMQGNRPRVGGPDEPAVLEQARNPILLLLKRDVVPVTVRMAGVGGQALIVSGPNAGGKSVTLSTIGLSVLMVRHGLVPPVGPGSVVPWYDNVYTVVGDPTNMDQAVSTFTGQLARLEEVMGRGPGRTLVLLDELATGTEPRKGEALATALIEALVDGGAECAVATHFDLLKQKAREDQRFANARVGLDESTGRPNFRLELGESGESNPFDIAAQLGFRGDILERAKALVGERERRLEEALDEARRLNGELLREKTETEELRKRLSEDKRKYEKELVRLRADSDRLVYDARREVLQKMKRLEEELDQIARQARAEQQKPATPETTAKVVVRRQEITRKKDEVRRDMDREDALVKDHPTEPLPASALKVGAVVWVTGLNAEAKVVDVAGDGRRATVQVGLLKSNVKLADLRVPKAKPPGKASQQPKVASRHASSRPEPFVTVTEFAGSPGEPADLRFIRTETNTADVRGMRVDEALTRVEELLDRAYVENLDTVMIIHGMGTSALRKAIREYLKTSRYSRAFRGGQQDEGADGVTIVEIG